MHDPIFAFLSVMDGSVVEVGIAYRHGLVTK